MASRKLFVGSLPNDITDASLLAEFGKYGQVEDIFIKPGCELGRQWAFVTMADPIQAQFAKDSTDRILHWPGCEKPCDVMVAKNQGMFGQDSVHGGPVGQPAPVFAQASPSAPKKIFVGSLPLTITDAELRAEFSRYGAVVDVHVNNKPCEPGRNWAFVTFATPEQAQMAKVSADRVIVFPGSDKACEVTMAKHQGAFGQDALGPTGGVQQVAPQGYVQQQVVVAGGPTKIFVGSLPQQVSQEILWAEFSKFGEVVDVHVNYKPCDVGKNWAFITFAMPEQATYAKDCTDKTLVIPGGDRPCEVMLARNQGLTGKEKGLVAATQGFAPAPGFAPALAHVAAPVGVQPPPPAAPPPASLTPWRMYKTAAGLPYYHNHTTGETQWECPPDLQVPGQGAYGAPVAVAQPQVVRYAPY